MSSPQLLLDPLKAQFPFTYNFIGLIRAIIHQTSLSGKGWIVPFITMFSGGKCISFYGPGAELPSQWGRASWLLLGPSEVTAETLGDQISGHPSPCMGLRVCSGFLPTSPKVWVKFSIPGSHQLTPTQRQPLRPSPVPSCPALQPRAGHNVYFWKLVPG